MAIRWVAAILVMVVLVVRADRDSLLALLKVEGLLIHSGYALYTGPRPIGGSTPMRALR